MYTIIKKITSVISACFIGLLLCGHANAADSTALKLKQQEYLSVFHTAMQYSDMPTAAMSLVSLMNTGGMEAYHDSLAVVYYSMSNFAGAYKIANESYTKNNKNVTALSLLADISGQTSDTKLSLDWYEKLCALNPLPYNYYQLATKQYALDRMTECKQSLAKVFADTAAVAKSEVTMVIGQGYSEKVPLLAAAYNMMGVLSFKENKVAEAKQNYMAALKVLPDFVIARQNIEALTKTATTNKKPAGKTK